MTSLKGDQEPTKCGSRSEKGKPCKKSIKWTVFQMARKFFITTGEGDSELIAMHFCEEHFTEHYNASVIKPIVIVHDCVEEVPEHLNFLTNDLQMKVNTF